MLFFYVFALQDKTTKQRHLESFSIFVIRKVRLFSVQVLQTVTAEAV